MISVWIRLFRKLIAYYFNLHVGYKWSEIWDDNGKILHQLKHVTKIKEKMSQLLDKYLLDNTNTC